MTSEQPPLEEFKDSNNSPGNDVWEEVVFSDVISINDYPSAEKGEEYRSVGMSDVARDQRKIDDWKYKEYSYSRPRFRNGQTLMARITPCLENGKTAFVDILEDNEVAVGSTEFIVLTDTDRTLPKFVYYTARRPEIRKFAIKRMTGTSGRQRVPLDIFDNKKIKLPPVEEQKKIVSMLDAIDSKIETNSQINDILEEMAQLIFESWFGDFEPFHEFKQTKGGKIPEEFEVANLGDMAEISHSRVDTGEKNQTNYHLFNFTGHDENKLPEIKSSDEINSQKYEVGDNTVMVSKLNPRIHRIWRVKSAPKNAISSTEFVNLSPFESESLDFLYSVVNSDDFQDYLESHTTGTSGSHQRVKKKDILKYQFPLPPQGKLEEFNTVISPLYDIINRNRKENRELEKLRDTLLPKLMSGEIRVNDIELDELEVDSEV